MQESKFVPAADKLYFLGGSAESETELMAFDTALQECGIHNLNILEVSSVVPEDAELIKNSEEEVREMIEPGDFYPVVVSKETSSNPGEEIYAAVAGCKFESGYGVNVEAHGSSKDRDEVKKKCRRMLEDMARRRDEQISGEIVFEYNSATVENTCCVISAVVYGRE